MLPEAAIYFPREREIYIRFPPYPMMRGSARLNREINLHIFRNLTFRYSMQISRSIVSSISRRLRIAIKVTLFMHFAGAKDKIRTTLAASARGEGGREGGGKLHMHICI